MSDVRDTTWRTSSFTNGGGSCVQVRATPARVDIRDSKDHEGSTLTLSMSSWSMFTRHLTR